MDWRPMLARDGEERLLDDGAYLFEPKLDGIRALARFDGSLSLFSRNDREITAAYPEIDFSIDEPCVIDGEIVLYDADGNPDFASLLGRHHRKTAPPAGRPVTFAVFDILSQGGIPLIDEPLEKRRAVLEEIMALAGPRVELTLVTEQGRRLFDLMRSRGLEGVIAKRKGSRYFPGVRSDVWQKIKVFHTADVLITGYRSDKRAVSSLEIGAYDGETVVPMGLVGAGLTDRMGAILRDALNSIRIGEQGDVIRVEPRIVAEVRYLQKTRDGSLRHASIVRIRTDKRPEEVRIEDIGT
jgi:bifunctional non-homologous end joining protein LigD